MSMKHTVDVHYVDLNIAGSQPAILDIMESWDGSYYGETNVKDLAGPARSVSVGGKAVTLPDGKVIWVNCPIKMVRYAE